MHNPIITEDLLNYCSTTAQKAIIEHLIVTGSMSVTAQELGMTYEAVRGTVRRVRARAALQGYSPEHNMTKPAPDTHIVKGVSTLYDGDGNVKMQWVKTDAKANALIDLANTLVEDIGSHIKPAITAKVPFEFNKNFLNVIPIGDGHIGMYADEEETGRAFTLAKNVELHQKAIEYLVGNSPSAETALIINCGDWVHINDPSNRTPRSGAPLDADGRWHTIVQAARDLLIYMIDVALVNHKKVKLISALGNHDPSTYLLNLVIAAHYSNEPRVEVDVTPSKFHYHQFGKNMIMVTHSDNIKPADAPQIMATDQPQMWGDTKYRYAHLGHFHHKVLISQDTKEHRGATVEIHRTLAASDAWHHGSGYRSMRECKCITLHREYGEVNRITVNPSMFED